MPDQLLEEPATELTHDDVFTTMSNQRRRYVLNYLRQEEGPVSLRDLSEQVACWENDVTLAELTRQQRKRVYTALHQTHLPMMDSLGIVTYDRNRTTVELTDAARNVDIYVEIIPKHHFTWPQYYVLLAGLVGALALALTQDLTPAWFTGELHSWFATAAFGASAVVHYVKSRGTRVDVDDPSV